MMEMIVRRRVFGTRITVPCAGCGKPAITMRIWKLHDGPVSGEFRHDACRYVIRSPASAWHSTVSQWVS